MSDFPEELRALLRQPDTAKVIATVGREGAPHVAARPTLQLLANGDLAFAEVLDSSQLSKDLVYALWFERPIAIGISRGEAAWQLTARPWRCVVAGPLLKQFLLAARAAQGPDADIATVWVLRVDAVRDDSPETQRLADAALRPNAGAHLDRESLVRRAVVS